MNSKINKINISTKETCYPNLKNLICVEKFFTEQVSKVTVTYFTQEYFIAKICHLQ